MRRKSLTLATLACVVAAALLTVPAAEAQEQVRAVAVDDCATMVQASSLVKRQAAPSGQARAVCFAPKAPPRGVRTATGPGPAKVAPRKPSGVGVNALPCGPGVWATSRYEVCKTTEGRLNLYRLVCEGGRCYYVPIGSMDIAVKYYEATFPHSASWRFFAEVSASSAEGEGLEGVDVKATFECVGSCHAQHSLFEPQHLTVGGKVSGEGSLRSTISGPDQRMFGRGKVTITFSPIHPGVSGSHTELVDPVTRCDTQASTHPGCVFFETAVVYGLPGDQYPEVANHVLMAQNSGLIGRDVPLTRMVNEIREQDNRWYACHPSIPRPSGLSCDEYPFASTYEGAAMWGTTGRRTFDGCRRSDLPQGVTGAQGWSACMVWDPDNRGQGADLKNFYFDNRVIDGDQFYVEVD